MMRPWTLAAVAAVVVLAGLWQISSASAEPQYIGFAVPRSWRENIPVCNKSGDYYVIYYAEIAELDKKPGLLAIEKGKLSRHIGGIDKVDKLCDNTDNYISVNALLRKSDKQYGRLSDADRALLNDFRDIAKKAPLQSGDLDRILLFRAIDALFPKEQTDDPTNTIRLEPEIRDLLNMMQQDVESAKEKLQHINTIQEEIVGIKDTRSQINIAYMSIFIPLMLLIIILINYYFNYYKNDRAKTLKAMQSIGDIELRLKDAEEMMGKLQASIHSHDQNELENVFATKWEKVNNDVELLHQSFSQMEANYADLLRVTQESRQQNLRDEPDDHLSVVEPTNILTSSPAVDVHATALVSAPPSLHRPALPEPSYAEEDDISKFLNKLRSATGLEATEEAISRLRSQTATAANVMDWLIRDFLPSDLPYEAYRRAADSINFYDYSLIVPQPGSRWNSQEHDIAGSAWGNKGGTQRVESLIHPGLRRGNEVLIKAKVILP